MLPYYQKSFALASKVERQNQAAYQLCAAVREVITATPNFYTLEDLESTYGGLIEKLRTSDLYAFETEFGPPPKDDIESLLRQLDEGSKAVDEALENHVRSTDVDQLQELCKFLLLCVHFTENYLESCETLVRSAEEQYLTARKVALLN